MIHIYKGPRKKRRLLDCLCHAGSEMTFTHLLIQQTILYCRNFLRWHIHRTEHNIVASFPRHFSASWERPVGQNTVALSAHTGNGNTKLESFVFSFVSVLSERSWWESYVKMKNQKTSPILLKLHTRAR